jgi:hypothetical protein
MVRSRPMSRRFGEFGVTTAVDVGLARSSAAALAQPGCGVAPVPAPRPESLKSEFLMDLIL